MSRVFAYCRLSTAVQPTSNQAQEIATAGYAVNAAYRCSMKGSASAQSSATRNGNFLRHQARDEGHVARQAIQLRHADRASAQLGSSQRSGELRPPVQCVCALARFDFHELARDMQAFGRACSRRFSGQSASAFE